MNLEEAISILEDEVNRVPQEKRDQAARLLGKILYSPKPENKKFRRAQKVNKALDNLIDKYKEGNKPTTENKVRMNEALELMEAIINEVSVGALARAAENNNQKRRDDAAKAIKGWRKSRSEYNKLADKYPEEEPALYRKLQADDKAAVKVYDKAKHAEGLKKLNLPKNSKVSANKLFKAAHKVEGKRTKEVEDAVSTTNKNFLNKLDRSNRADNVHFEDPVKSRANEALAIVEEMLSLANSIFEVAPEAAQQAEVPPSENKIKRTVKDKDSKKDKEVVSVADELFPYEGNAKQQMNQKILAKINQMIEGTATLEDLLQLVRKSSNVKKAGIRESFDRAEAMLEELINEVSKEYLYRKRRLARDEADRHLVRSYVEGTEIGDEKAEKYHRDNFDKADKRIKQFETKMKSYLNKKEKKNAKG